MFHSSNAIHLKFFQSLSYIVNGNLRQQHILPFL
jgi:hypothetical protein